ncbi:MAG: TIR domain-containing protein [Nitrospira sp.]|nr:TIR domain-containing protein [Nitrospira sp.]
MRDSSGSQADPHLSETSSEIVLCYRHETAADFAYIVHQHLTSCAYCVFWDRDHSAGNWQDHMLALIQSAQVVVVVLVSSNDLALSHEDYFLEEITHALRCKKIIIPIMREGFQWPDNLPSEITGLKHQHGVVISHRSRESDLQRLTSLLDQPRKGVLSRRWWMVAGIAVAVALATALLAIQLPTFITEMNTASPLTVYSDVTDQNAIGNWTLYMPENGREMIMLDLSHTVRPFSGHTAVRLTIQLTAPWWCGIGTTMPNARRLPSQATLGLWARGERGNEQIQVKVGVSEQFPEGLAQSPWLALSTDWQRYEIPVLTDQAVTNLFTVIADRAHNPSGQLTVFFDEIVLMAK